MSAPQNRFSRIAIAAPIAWRFPRQSSVACRRRQRGVTLLELILALTLTVMILGAVTLAINLNLRTLDRRRNEVEEAQLARAVLRMIADDLRSAVQQEEVDFSSVESMASGIGDVGALASSLTGSAGAAGGGAAGGGAAGGGAGSSSAAGAGAGATAAADSSSQDIAATAAPPDVPGLYGNQSEMQVDVSRLPRVDEYSTMVTADGTTKIPSDVKTVAYYVRSQPLNGTASTPDTVTPGLNSQGSGLVRRELPRVVTNYAIQNATGEQMLQGGDLIAPEVSEIQFRYFDGQQWLSEWDSQAMQGLPLAVEVVIVVQPAEVLKQVANGQPLANAAVPGATPFIYRSVVRVPSAQLVKQAAASSTDTSGAASNGTGTGGSTP